MEWKLVVHFYLGALPESLPPGQVQLCRWSTGQEPSLEEPWSLRAPALEGPRLS